MRRRRRPLLEAWAQAASGVDRVVLDFGGTEYINSTGLAVIVQLLARARADRCDVHAFGLSDHYREIFEITRLADFVTLHPDRAAARDLSHRRSPAEEHRHARN